jgi:hypothetical protein
MHRPSQITDEALWESLCRDVVHAATAVRERTVPLIEASSELADLSHVVCASDDPDFLVFVDIAFDADFAPADESAADRSDDAESRRTDAARHAAARLIEKYGRN